VLIPIVTYTSVLSKCLEVYPNEACGIIAGRSVDNGTMMAYALRNVSPTPTIRFSTDRDEQLGLWRYMDRRGDVPIIAFHSHTREGSSAEPSPDDIESHDPDMMMLIVCLSDPITPTARLWKIHSGRAVRFPLATA